MKRCIKAHVVASFGQIPVGSLWADDSPFIEDESAFVDAAAPPPVATLVGESGPEVVKPVRKRKES